ncbi:uncharacterized protein LOC102804131 [Saccoglossus kowalevskii]|uniref:Uncharacterized protein LOC102804131 n=1 Tax=Saccoglossus kowalevskii TaxID=10224 RepID=A0ABM0MEA6_SACKO|nr:PREDICTED: uncharacterized protein LOC102804131 [Saccoglossus kowalevskii]
METDVLDEVNQNNIKNEEIMDEQIHKEKNGENVAMETESESEKYRIKQLRNVGMESTSSVTQSSQISVRTTKSCTDSEKMQIEQSQTCIKSESIEEIQDQEKTDDVTALLKSCANTKNSTDRLKPVENIDMGSRSTDTGSNSTKDTDIIPGNYSDLVKDYCLVYHDTDLRTFNDMKNRAPCKKTKFNKAYPKPDHYPIESINKVCWNPNFSVNQWILTAGHSGIVRVHYLDGMIDNAKDKKS